MFYYGKGTREDPYIPSSSVSMRKVLVAICAIVEIESRDRRPSFYYKINNKLFEVLINGEGPIQQLPNLSGFGNITLHEPFSFLVFETIVTAVRIE